MARFNQHLALSASLLCLAISAAQAAPPPGKGYNKNNESSSYEDSQNHSHGHGKNNADSTQNNNFVIHAGITVGEARILVDELQINRSQYKALPPGIAKNLARGKPLPPGIAKKMAPSSMISRLPVHPGYQWQIAGTSLVLVASSSGIVVDILINVF